MIARQICERVLQKAVSTGADFAELFVENTLNHTIDMVDSLVDDVDRRPDRGCIRAGVQGAAQCQRHHGGHQ